MSHECNEIIMPPTTDVEKAVAEIMARFNENGDDEDGYKRHAFWDFYVIGGRFAGSKTEARLDPEALAAFNQWMHDEMVMVRGLQFGKQTLADRATVEKVDAKWCELFPGAGPHCTLFDHSNKRDEALPDDVCKLADLPARLTAFRVIIAGPKFDGKDAWTGPPEAVYMVSTSIWNGVTHVKTAWDGNVAGAVAMFRERLDNYSPAYRACVTPTDEWIAVTVDTHT